jgi:hypothetical protein
MKTLLESINVTTDENQSVSYALSVSVQEWHEMKSVIELEELVMTSECDFADLAELSLTEDFDQSVDVVMNALNNADEYQTVYFWFD